ncbi:MULTISPECIES: TonB-dependent receptor [unclassified Prevotella]|uniref:SusC/RagA family TonB-linked outer membrane protein n=1 Tax=unclassified Prevotella TaxID=2638335 RepID=UPI00048F32BB|nr:MULTISPECIES: TonB-dependent receptor [unclassified Prevotella]
MDKHLRLSLFLALTVSVASPQWVMAGNGMTKTTQQNGTVKGRVLDGNGEPIIGASVQVKGNESTGTISNMDGSFSISGVTSGTLIISYVGFETKTVAFTSGQNLTVTLKEDSQALSEVVVVGYGTQKKANLTGSVASVNFNDVANIPVANTSTMLQGRLPGVVLQTNGAQAGHDDPEIRVRGVGTLGSGSKNNPMVLIDGIESSISQMSALAAEDIESVSVLKDAASAAIYGVRAANGVILVTTKRGADMRPTVTYSGSIALQEATVLPDFVNSYEWAKMYNECQPAKAYTDEMLQKLKDGSDPDHFANTQWAKEMYRTAAMHQHHLSVSGGGKDMHYMLSAQYMDQDGILKNTANRRYNFRSNIDAKLGLVKLGLNLSGSKQDIKEPVKGLGGDGLLRTLTWYTRPTVPVRYSNGEYGCVDGNNAIGASVFKNPIYDLNNGYKKNEHYRFDGQIFGEIDLYKGLKFRTSLSYKYYNNNTTSYDPRSAAKVNAEGTILAPAGTQNTLTDYQWIETSLTNENILTYTQKFGEHQINVLLGHSIQSSRWDTNTASRQGFPTDNIYELDGGSQNDHVSGSAEETRLQSFFGRVNYNYGDRYLAEFNVRRDGSSRLPSSNRYATFPSFSAAWIISNESFMQDLKWLSSLKIRGSWGKLGNQEIGNYAYSETLSAQGSYYLGDQKYIGMKTSKIANEKIKWETTTVTDFGFDASFLQGRVSLTFDWYNKVTNDILLQLPMPGIFLGSLSAPYQNAGKVRNRGWELSANYQDRKGDWQWQAGFNLAAVSNKIIDMNGQESISGSTINREGEAIGSYYALKAIGIYRTEADLQRKNSAGVVIKQNGQAPVLGDIMYEDLNDDGNITDDDRQIIGNPFPKLQYAFTLGASYKNFDLTTFWQGIAGLYRFNWDETTISNGGNKTSRWLDRYSPDNVNGSMPRMGGEFNNTYSSFWLTKGDYLRLKSLELGYTFKANPLLAKAGIQSLRLYLAGSNLLTFTSLDDYDPEKTGSDTRNDVHPNVRAYSFGINVKF